MKGVAKMAGPTPEQIAKFGHIAARLRAELDKRGWSPGDFNDALGKDRSNGNIYHFLGAKSAPGETLRAQIADFLDIPEADLTARPDSGALVKAERIPREETAKIPPPHTPKDIVTFSINEEGMARIRCDVTLPAGKGAALLQVLLNAGLALGADHEP
jgi:hypothetical protein